ncbi:MAG: NADH-quinone oxidoreductase subunit H [Nannocystaceae bacterium]|nr:NADH-quinone oxidoreductase subunit H [Nannocystaceae bacterium]
MTANLRYLLLSLFTLVGLVLPSTGCGDPPSGIDTQLEIRTEPGELVFHPETAEIEIAIVNNRDVDLFVGDFRIEGPDWQSFAIIDDIAASALPKGAKISLRIKANPGDFVGPGEHRSAVRRKGEASGKVGHNEFRVGKAQLVFTVSEPLQQHESFTQSVQVSFEDPSWWQQYALPAAAKILMLVMGFIMPLASLLTWMERKQSAMMQDRIGPNRANIRIGSINLRLWGLLHIATDGLKMLFKEDFIPKRAHRALYTLAPLFGLIPALVVFAIVPFGDALCYDGLFDTLSQADVDQCAAGRGGTAMQIAHIDVGLLYYFAIASIATYGTALAGWSSYNKWAVLGALRASAQMISYEVAIGLSLVGVLLVYGSLEPHAIVHAQMDSYWGIVLQPVAFILFFTAAIAETKRAPFDLPEGESEIIGYFLEYSGMRFGLFFLAEFIEVVFVSALLATLFLGGWTLPFGLIGASGFTSELAAQLFFAGGGALLTALGVLIWRTGPGGELVGGAIALLGLGHLFLATWSLATGWGTELPHLAIVLIGMLTWGLKILVLCWLQLLIRWTLPRFRYDQLMSLGWKSLLPLSIANIVLTAVVVFFMMPSADRGDQGAKPVRDAAGNPLDARVQLVDPSAAKSVRQPPTRRPGQ